MLNDLKAGIVFELIWHDHWLAEEPLSGCVCIDTGVVQATWGKAFKH
jgi:hypothetical protein